MNSEQIELQRLAANCGRKIMFLSKSEAKRYAKKMNKSGGNIHPYHCKICGNWHNGHKNKNNKTIATAHISPGHFKEFRRNKGNRKI